MNDRTTIRELRADEQDAWLRLRVLLWPDFDPAELGAERAGIIADRDRNRVLVAAAADGGLVGFVEVSLRDWADGCTTRPVGYIEAWYVEPEFRRTGVGRRLIEEAETWARSRGCSEMASDAEVRNPLGIRAHGALGYAEVQRVVLFRKRLADATAAAHKGED